VECLEKTVKTESGKEAWEVVAALVNSYQQLHRTEAARMLLNLATQDPNIAEAARRMLREIEGAD
jgi:hypothetical protein